MNDFSIKELAGSLAIPILTLLWGLIYIIDRLPLGADFWVYGISRLLAIIIGGALPIFLTLKYKIHTEDYLKTRFIFIITVYSIFFVAGFLKIMWQFFLYILVGIGAIILEIFKVQDEGTTNKERAVIMLSDPIIYWTLENLIFSFITIIDLGPSLRHYGW